MKDRQLGMGWLRRDGRKGIRNRLLVLYLSPCARFAARRIAGMFPPDRVEVVGFDRCADSPFVLRKLGCYATHPNVGAVLVVAQGCEPMDGASLCRQAEGSGRPCRYLAVGECGGVAACIRAGEGAVRALLGEMDSAPRAPVYFRDLVIGGECGGSDFTSGLAANPVVGRFFDRMVDLGGTVLFEEMYEAVGLKDYLVSRAADARAAEQLAATYDKFFCSSRDSNQFFITPGNMNGGLTSIEEKSMGAVVKSGTRPISGVVKLCQTPPHPGLWHMDGMTDRKEGCGPYTSEDATSLLLYATCGTTLNLLTSGRGHLVNTPIAPTVKLTGNRQTMQALAEDTDFDASPVIYGEKTLDQLADELMELVAAVAAGQLTRGEALGHREGVINQEWQDSQRGCGCG